MSNRASLTGYPSSSTVATLPTDGSFNSLRITKGTSPNITGHGDKTVALVCDGHVAVEGTVWANRVRGSSSTTCDPRAKRDVAELTDHEFLPGIRNMKLYQFCYKTDPSTAAPMMGPMADQVLEQFPLVADVPKNPKEYLGVNLCGYTSVCLGGIKELDIAQQAQTKCQAHIVERLDIMEQQISRLKNLNEQLTRDLRVQADRIREQDDRLRANADRLREKNLRLTRLEKWKLKMSSI